MNVTDMKYEGLDWIKLAQDMIKCGLCEHGEKCI
jgi:hypothetical protein